MARSFALAPPHQEFQGWHVQVAASDAELGEPPQPAAKKRCSPALMTVVSGAALILAGGAACVAAASCRRAGASWRAEQGKEQNLDNRALLYAADFKEVEQPLELLPWDQAMEKARETEEQLSPEERASLLHGQGFLTVNNWVGTVNAIPRLGVPALKLQDSSNGFRPTAPGEYGSVTSWPSSLALAAAWDEEMVTKVGRAIAREFRGKGANVILGPGVNTHRTPYGGRNFEYLSGEDPYLGARNAAAYVKAVQGEGVMAVVKHFAFNEQETNRGEMNAIPSERASWELYYPPFEAAIRAGAGAIMCSYNRVNGTHACGNEKILRRDLKDTMGFTGFVMSDWDAVHGSNNVESGLDMEQPGSKFLNKDALAYVNVEAVREAARRVLASIYHVRLDQRPGCGLPCDAERKRSVRSPEHLKIAEEAATGSVVLLKNDGILPLTKRVKTIAVLGPAAKAGDAINTWGPGSPYSGGGSGHVAAPRVVTPLQGLAERAKALGIKVLDDESEVAANATPAVDARAQLKIDVHVNTKAAPAPEEDFSPRLRKALKVAESAEVVIVVGACTTTESKDRASLALDDAADELINALAKLKKPVIVLMEVPGAVLTPWREEVSAIAALFYGGEVTGKAWASVLFGDAEPRGKLPINLPLSDEETIKPGSEDVVYKEGVFTSYRSTKDVAAFPFGYGLSYTTLVLGPPRQVADCPVAACIELDVSNIGARPGSEVVQAYIVFDPRLKSPVMTLRGFHRTKTLRPGETEKVRLELSARDLSTYVVGEGWRQQEWVVARLGTSSGDIRHLLPLHSAIPVKVLQ